MTRTSDVISDEAALARPSWGQPMVHRGILAEWQQERVLALALDAIDTLGLRISATTSVVNRLVEKTAEGISHDTLLVFLPEEPHNSLAPWWQLIGSQLSVDQIADLQEFHARLATARSMTLAYCRYPAAVRYKGGVHIEVLSGVWRDLCEHTVALIFGLWSAVDETKRRPSSSLRSMVLLSACANGSAPCVMDDGTIEIKGWAERRRYARWVVSWPATISNGPTVAVAQIVDVSLWGFGLVTTEPLIPAEQICVELLTGQRLTGSVQWARRNHYGIKFATPLLATDALVAAAQSGSLR